MRKYQVEMPSDEDLFANKSHECVAKAISKDIVSGGKHIIGVEGEYGSGKSTIIKLALDEVDRVGEPGKFHHVIFDAEKYQRSLKVGLIHQLVLKLKENLSEKECEDNEIDLNVERALGFLTEIEKDTSTKISFSDYILLASLVTFGAQLKSAVAFAIECFRGTGGKDIAGGEASFILALMSLCVACPIFLKNFKLNRGVSIMDMLKKNGKDVIVERTKRRKDVGAIELRFLFEKIGEWIPDGKVFILVIDNIDRLSPELVKDLWSDVDVISSSNSNKLRLLLPYSPNHIAKSLEKSMGDDSLSGREFISKRVPVIFRTPPVLMGCWGDIFKGYWSETLNDIDGCNETISLMYLWEHIWIPRVMKGLINNIATTIESNPSSFKINGLCCAIYELLIVRKGMTLQDVIFDSARNADADADADAVEKSIRLLDISVHEWREQIVAIHYNCSLKDAMVIFVNDKLASGQASSVAKLFKELPKREIDIILNNCVYHADISRIIETLYALCNEINFEHKSDLIKTANKTLSYKTKCGSEFKLDERHIHMMLDLIDLDIGVGRDVLDLNNKFLGGEILHGLGGDVFNSMGVTSEEVIKKAREFSAMTRQYYECRGLNDDIPGFILSEPCNFIIYILPLVKDEVEVWCREVYKLVGFETLLRQMRLFAPSDIVFNAGGRFSQLDTFNYMLNEVRLGYDEIGIRIDIASFDNYHSLDVLCAVPFSDFWFSGNGDRNRVLSECMHLIRMIANDNVEICNEFLAALIINNFDPESSDAHNYLPDNLKPRVELQSANELVCEFISKCDAKDFESYFCTCDLSSVMKWMRDPLVGEYVSQTFSKAILNRRVCSIDVHLFVKEYFDVLHGCIDDECMDLLILNLDYLQEYKLRNEMLKDEFITYVQSKDFKKLKERLIFLNIDIG
ncbi:P-loop NTPase fold protein [Plesiomonas shigelloides]|uniref:P-loop NTPase fold protein n=1 Tax=Plesiomonas shigelloides TaxID=703 RepID=UPI000A10D955|nr:P-loop NTPase fold protein [Plesiomonas shigelloides]